MRNVCFQMLTFYALFYTMEEIYDKECTYEQSFVYEFRYDGSGPRHA